MGNKHIYTSNTVSRLLSVPYSEEPNLAESLSGANNGIFIGNSIKMNMPIFLDFNFLFNPHVFIVGMTGSGKTYLMKSILLRLGFMIDASVIILDFTGEYLETANVMGMESNAKQRTPDDININKSTYFMLKGLKEDEKAQRASEILKAIATRMRGNLDRQNKRTFVLLDESWKLINSNEDLEIIVREGRKYGVGLLLASQLLEDMSDGIVANSASVFIFRMQVRKSAEKVMANYNLNQEYIETIQGLDQGRCLLIKLDKANKRSITVIRRVLGIAVSPKTTILFPGK